MQLERQQTYNRSLFARVCSTHESLFVKKQTYCTVCRMNTLFSNLHVLTLVTLKRVKGEQLCTSVSPCRLRVELSYASISRVHLWPQGLDIMFFLKTKKRIQTQIHVSTHIITYTQINKQTMSLISGVV